MSFAAESAHLEAPGEVARLAGGMHGLPEWQARLAGDHDVLGSDSCYFFNGRSAIRTLVEALRPKRVWLPSFVCQTVTEAVARAGLTPAFYPLEERLQCADRSWVRDVQPDDLVVVIDYFGFPADPTLIAVVQERGARVLEDAAHALPLGHRKSAADFVLYSFRKLIGIPAGAALVAKCAKIMRSVALQRPSLDVLATIYRAYFQRTEADLTGRDQGWFATFQEAERQQPMGEFGIDDLSATLLRSAFNFNAIAAARRRNYVFLGHQLGAVALSRQLPPDVVPLGFPVVLPNRDDVQQRLFAERIFCPVHWSLAGFVPEQFAASHRLSKRILTLVCDQRCTTHQLETTVQIVREMAT